MSDHWDDHGEKPKKHTVGYGRPPKEHQFQKGESGNPSGRRKGSKSKQRGLKSLEQLLMQEGLRSINVVENGRKLKMPVIQTVVRRLGNRAMGGEPRATTTFLKLYSDAESAQLAEAKRLFDAFVAYKNDPNTADPNYYSNDAYWLDPRDIDLDYDTLTATVRSPLTASHAEAVKHAAVLRDDMIFELREAVSFRGSRVEPEGTQYEMYLRESIKRSNAILPTRMFRDADAQIEEPSIAALDAAIEYMKDSAKRLAAGNPLER